MKWLSKFYLQTPFLVFLLSASGCSGFIVLGDDNSSDLDYDRGYRSSYSESSEAEDEIPTLKAKNQAYLEDGAAAEESRSKIAIRARDVILGMTVQEVLQSWGEPTQVEVAGKGERGHERWTYGSRFSLNGNRVIIFEDGKVAGWYR
ncbi:MAG: DUF2845 domain-containing protein [Oligoflexia bacterium]|nr:DUF2845 domain-containing protein [Oligoflexia bacterium]